MATEESKEQRAARKAYLTASRHLQLERHDLAQEVVHRNWVAAGAVAAAVSVVVGGLLAWLVSPVLVFIAIAGTFALVLAGICCEASSDDVRRARKRTLRAELDFQDAQAEYLGIDPPPPV